VGRLSADLLVAGTHGRTGVAHAFLGSVAEDLLHQAHCDVLVAKAW
jgi:nucleotide-binding universal stress UspA family protein